MPAAIDTMFSVREVPWHGLGEIVATAPTSADALKLAGLDWEVKQLAVVHAGQDSGYKMNIRSSDQKVLGVVGSRYKPIQNEEAFSFTDAIAGRDMYYETAGSLNGGKRIWLLGKMEQRDILGDKVDPYIVFTNNHDGFGSLKVFMTPVRVVCQNTLNLALRGANRMWSARHTGSIEAKMSEAQRTLGLATAYLNNLTAEAEELAKIKVAPKDFELLSGKLFPIETDMTERKKEAQELLRLQLRNAWEVDDLGNLKGTGWGFMNAVSDMSTHKPPVRKTENSKEGVFTYTLDYPVLLDQALVLLRKGA